MSPWSPARPRCPGRHRTRGMNIRRISRSYRSSQCPRHRQRAGRPASRKRTRLDGASGIPSVGSVPRPASAATAGIETNPLADTAKLLPHVTAAEPPVPVVPVPPVPVPPVPVPPVHGAAGAGAVGAAGAGASGAAGAGGCRRCRCRSWCRRCRCRPQRRPVPASRERLFRRYSAGRPATSSWASTRAAKRSAGRLPASACRATGLPGSACAPQTSVEHYGIPVTTGQTPALQVLIRVTVRQRSSCPTLALPQPVARNRANPHTLRLRRLSRIRGESTLRALALPQPNSGADHQSNTRKNFEASSSG